MSTLKITNKNDFPIVYKVYIILKQFKASSLNRFVIRPNSGVLKQGQTLDVQIVLHKDVFIIYKKIGRRKTRRLKNSGSIRKNI